MMGIWFETLEGRIFFGLFDHHLFFVVVIIAKSEIVILQKNNLLRYRQNIKKINKMNIKFNNKNHTRLR